MTIRERLSRTRKRLYLIGFAFWLGCGMALLLTIWHVAFAPLLAVMFLGFFATVLMMMFRLRCSNCGNNLSYAIQWPPTWFGISPTIKYCPFCGISLDTEEDDVLLNRSGPSA